MRKPFWAAGPDPMPDAGVPPAAVAALVLAGGASRRFGAGHKLLHRLGGRSLIERALQPVLAADFVAVVVVTGALHDTLLPLLDRYPVHIVHNPAHAGGMATSLRAGLRALYPGAAAPAAGAAGLAGGGPDAVCVCLADQPFLTPTVFDRLITAFRKTRAPIVAPVAAGKRQNPVLFARALVPELLGVEGDEGGRSVLARHAASIERVPFEDPAPFRDVDTPADLA